VHVCRLVTNAHTSSCAEPYTPHAIARPVSGSPMFGVAQARALVVRSSAACVLVV
jgi:hypothetical protein